MQVGSRFRILSNRFLQSNVKKRALNRFLERHFCNITSSEYLRKLNEQRLTRKEVEHLIRDRGLFEERLNLLEQRLDTINSGKVSGFQPPKNANPLLNMRQS